MAHWLLQCNPASGKLDEFLGEDRKSTVWTVRRHHEQMTAGDDVAVWLSGRGGGVVAVGHLTGAPYPEAAPPDAERPRTARERGSQRWLVPVTFTQVFVDHPVSREALKQDDRFADSLIQRVPRGANPFPVEDTAWPAIAERLPPQGSQLVAKTVMATAAVVAAGATAVREALRAAAGLDTPSRS